ncbi:Tripartite DNA replication factor [Entomortierella chlamydospora]|nr:Tripartite DNA replication factor [Entomortierella chlamydospora]
MSGSDNNDKFRQGLGTSNSLQNLLQSLSLTDDSSAKDCESNEIIDEESHYSSTRSSLDFSFSSLHISAEDWESIDEETRNITCTVQPSQTIEVASSFKNVTKSSPATVQPRTTAQPTSENSSEPVPDSLADNNTINILGSDSEHSQLHEGYRFSPSVLAHHANTLCEKMLHLKGRQLWQQSLKRQAETSINESDRGVTSLAEATMQRGINYESRLQSAIQDKIDCEAEHDKDSFFRLAASPEGTTLCQPVFSLDEGFYTPNMKKAGIVFGRFIPDFIRILPGMLGQDGKRKKRLFIIDAKSSSHVKTSHQIQVTLYAIFLSHLIKVNKQEHLVEIDPRGGVWIPQHKEPQTFSLVFMRPIVENFIFEELPSILMKPLRSAVWHIDSPCLQCEFLPSCKVDAAKQNTLSLIPLLSKKSALWVKSLFSSSSSHNSDIQDLEDLVRDRALLSQPDQVSLAKTLRLDADGNSPLLAAYRSHSLQVLDVRTTELPRLHQDRLLINILIDPLTTLPFAYSLNMFKEQSLHPTRSIANSVVHLPDETDAFTSNLIGLTVELIDNLYEWLHQISQIRPKAPILSMFIYNQSMQDSLCNLLLKVISEKSEESSTWPTATKERAMDLLVNMYEDPSFLALSELAEFNVRLPDILQLTQGFKNNNPCHDKRVFAIETALQKLLVLPVVGSYSFKHIMKYLVDVEAPSIFDESERDDDGYNLESIYHKWSNGASCDEIQSTIQRWVEQQNVILISLYKLIRHKHSNLSAILVAPQAPFKIRSRLEFRHNILAQIAFFKQWEAITAAESRRKNRITLTKDEAIQRQEIFQCRFLGRHVAPLPGEEPGVRSPRAPSNKPSSEYIAMFEISNHLNTGSITCSTFKQWILSADNPTGMSDRIRFDDINALLRAYGHGTPVIVCVPYYDPETNIVYVSGGYSNMLDNLGLTEGENYILERREYDPTLSTSMAKLVEMDKSCRLFLDLMKDPNKWGQQRPEKSADVFLESITNSIRQYDMTLSQEQAFSKVINNRLQVIWGPPGSGKTHFLALTILRFTDVLRSLSDKGRGQGSHTIVVTAFTHTAINNLVARIAKLHEAVAPHVGSEHLVRPLVMYRLKDPSSTQLNGTLIVEPADLAKLQRRTEETGNEDIVRIVCGTVWQIRRAAHPESGVDYMRNVQMLMIDEGSQLLAGDAIHAIECLDPQHGRLIVAGDHLQLGPVISGEYPSTETAFDPTGSIMKNLMRRCDNSPVQLQWVEGGADMEIGPCTSQLQDNFRMNDQLGLFMKTIYGANYQVQTPNRTLPYSGGYAGSSIPMQFRRILDPSISAVCIELQLAGDIKCPEAVRVKSDNRVAAYLEATFVAGILDYYLEMVGKDTVTSLFVAVPHHVQRLAIIDKLRLPELEQKYPMAQIKVDTIEKMQGQEADMMIVCFALFDDTTLVNELTHLYSIHRWIVALSRARCKTVLLMTPELKSPRIISGTGKASPSELERLDGWGLLQAFEKYAAQLGGKAEWPITQNFLRGIGIGL